MAQSDKDRREIEGIKKSEEAAIEGGAVHENEKA
jgi:hypothetical protein